MFPPLPQRKEKKNIKLFLERECEVAEGEGSMRYLQKRADIEVETKQFIVVACGKRYISFETENDVWVYLYIPKIYEK